MTIIQKFLFALIILQNDGTVKFEQHLLIDECPPQELITMAMDARVEEGEFLSWNGICYPLLLPKPDTAKEKEVLAL